MKYWTSGTSLLYTSRSLRSTPKPCFLASWNADSSGGLVHQSPNFLSLSCCVCVCQLTVRPWIWWIKFSCPKIPKCPVFTLKITWHQVSTCCRHGTSTRVWSDTSLVSFSAGMLKNASRWSSMILVVMQTYCRWLKSCTTWDVWNPINNGIFTISTGAGFQPSTVGPTFTLVSWDAFFPIFFGKLIWGKDLPSDSLRWPKKNSNLLSINWWTLSLSLTGRLSFADLSQRSRHQNVRNDSTCLTYGHLLMRSSCIEQSIGVRRNALNCLATKESKLTNFARRGGSCGKISSMKGSEVENSQILKMRHPFSQEVFSTKSR